MIQNIQRGSLVGIAYRALLQELQSINIKIWPHNQQIWGNGGRFCNIKLNAEINCVAKNNRKICSMCKTLERSCTPMSDAVWMLSKSPWWCHTTNSNWKFRLEWNDCIGCWNTGKKLCTYMQTLRRQIQETILSPIELTHNS